MSKFTIKENIDYILYSTYNLISSIIFNFNFFGKRIISNNLFFKDKHVGERCFILGTGPSLEMLKPEQVNALSLEYTIAVNSYYKSRLADVVIPNYYTLIDDLFWKDLSGTFDEVNKKFSGSTPTFITDLRAKYNVDSLGKEAEGIYVYAKKYPTKKVSSDVEGNIYATMNVVSTSILVAIFLGFKRIYLLGCDYNAFCTYGKGHCYDDKEELSLSSNNLAYFLKFYWITTEFHYLIAKLAKEKNVEIVNISRGSLLDAYQREDASIVL